VGGLWRDDLQIDAGRREHREGPAELDRLLSAFKFDQETQTGSRRGGQLVLAQSPVLAGAPDRAPGAAGVIIFPVRESFGRGLMGSQAIVRAGQSKPARLALSMFPSGISDRART